MKVSRTREDNAHRKIFDVIGGSQRSSSGWQNIHVDLHKQERYI